MGKSPLLAAICSFFIPGLGQVYNGEGILKGLLFYAGTIIGSLILVIPGLAIWLYGIYNAYNVAQKMNRGEIPYKEASLLGIIAYIVIVIIIAIILTVIAILFSAVIVAFIYGMTGSTY
jgi:TM2 domain-containing membrane protein YozV